MSRDLDVRAVNCDSLCWGLHVKDEPSSIPSTLIYHAPICWESSSLEPSTFFCWPLGCPSSFKHIGTYDKSYLMQTWIHQETIAARIWRKFRKTADMDTTTTVHRPVISPLLKFTDGVHGWFPSLTSSSTQENFPKQPWKVPPAHQ